MKRRKPIKRMSAKREVESKEYARLRRAFLAERPYCEMVLALTGKTQAEAIEYNGQIPMSEGPGGMVWTQEVPRSTDVHHKEKRGKNYLNVDTWMAVARSSHEYIESHKSWARRMGFLK